jgi:hypothetical protein
MREVPADRRGPVRAWLAEHGYEPKVPLVVRAEHVAELGAVLAEALGPDEPEPADDPGRPFAEVPA